MRLKVFLGHRIKFRGIEEAGAGGENRRRRIDSYHIKLIRSAIQISSAIVNDHVCERRAQ